MDTKGAKAVSEKEYNEIKQISDRIQNIHDYMIRAVGIYRRLANERMKVIEDLNKFYFSGGNETLFKENIAKLKNCHIRERTFLNRLKPAIDVTLDELSKLTSGKIHMLDTEEKDILKSMLNALKFMKEKIYLTEKRIVLEEEYTNSQNEKTYSKYHSAWKDERSVEDELINIINPAYHERFEHFRDLEKYKYGAMKGGSVGAALGGLSGAGLSEKMLLGGAAGALLIGIFGATLGMIEEYKKMSVILLDEQDKALLKFQYKIPR